MDWINQFFQQIGVEIIGGVIGGAVPVTIFWLHRSETRMRELNASVKSNIHRIEDAAQEAYEQIAMGQGKGQLSDETSIEGSSRSLRDDLFALRELKQIKNKPTDDIDLALELLPLVRDFGKFARLFVGGNGRQSFQTLQKKATDKEFIKLVQSLPDVLREIRKAIGPNADKKSDWHSRRADAVEVVTKAMENESYSGKGTGVGIFLKRNDGNVSVRPRR